jgi:hypothetical protein
VYDIQFAIKTLKLYKSLRTVNMSIVQQISSKQDVKYHVLASRDIFILFGTRKNFHSSGRNLLLYLCIKWR